MIEYRKLDWAECKRYHKQLSNLYFENVISHRLTESFSTDLASSKIDEMQEYIYNNKAFVFAAMEGATMVGFLWSYPYSFRDEERLYISAIQVLDEYRSNGIGAKLLSMAEQAAIANGFSAIYTHAEACNAGAIKLYEREGFAAERIQLCKRIEADNA